MMAMLVQTHHNFLNAMVMKKTAILLFKDRTLGLTGDNKVLFIPEAITTRELDNNFLTTVTKKNFLFLSKSCDNTMHDVSSR